MTARFRDLLRSIASDDWGKPTDGPIWDVRAVTGHTAGMLATFTSHRTMMRAMASATRTGKRSDLPMIDMLTSQQVADHVELSTSDLIERFEDVGPNAAKWRTTRPQLFRTMRMTEEVGGRRRRRPRR